jgi:transglutaminase-like putative cysteine protease
MRLTIEHRTRYRYSREVMLQPHKLIVTPRDSGGLTTVQRSLECSPPAEISWTIDVFGNLVATANFFEPARELIIVGKAVVDHVAPEWPIYAISPEAHSYPFTYSLDDVIDLGALAQPDWLTPGGERVGAWARAFVMALQTDSLSLLKDLNSGVLGDIHCRVRDEEGTQSPAGTLELRSGSCRDIAALFIELPGISGSGREPYPGICSILIKQTKMPAPPMPGPRCTCPARVGSPSTRLIAVWATASSSPWRLPGRTGRLCQ